MLCYDLMEQSKLIIVFLLIILFPYISFADAAPKLDPKLEIEINAETGELIRFDTIIVFVQYQQRENIDTLTNFHKTGTWWETGGVSNFPADRIIIHFRHEVKHFQLYIQNGSETYTSKFIYPIRSWSYLEFSAKNGELILNNNLFYTQWFNYFISLGLTIFLELLILLLFKQLRDQYKAVVLFVFNANFISHPLLWYLDTNFENSLILLEIGVILVEFSLLFWFFRNKMPFPILIIFILTANLFSWIFGGICYWIITN